MTDTSYVTGSRQVILVDEHDNQIGTEDILAAHRHPLQLHRAISVWLYRLSPQPEFLFQQRSAHKIIGPSWWGNAVCGNLNPTEKYLECAYRRLADELGITATPNQNQPKFARCTLGPSDASRS